MYFVTIVHDLNLDQNNMNNTSSYDNPNNSASNNNGAPNNGMPYNNNFNNGFNNTNQNGQLYANNQSNYVGFYEQGGSYKQILANYIITNTSDKLMRFDGLISISDLLLPDGTQINKTDNHDFYSNDSPDYIEIKPGAKVHAHLAIQLNGDNRNNIPNGNYQFKTSGVDEGDYNTVADPVNITLKF